MRRVHSQPLVRFAVVAGMILAVLLLSAILLPLGSDHAMPNAGPAGTHSSQDNL